LYEFEILSKNSAKLWFFFSKKKLTYLKSKTSIKFHRLLFHFYFFSIFGIFFYFTYPNLSKNYVVICSVLLEALEILSTNSENF